MAALPKPDRSLRILTIDGGRLDVDSTALVLQRTLDAIPQKNKEQVSKTRPCDIFDVIAGVGPGEWLALLLGRFQLDVISALAEYHALADYVKPPSWFEHLLVGLLHRRHNENDELTDEYQTDKHMFVTGPEDTRCKHVFVFALNNDHRGQNEYNLLRTYDRPRGSNVLEGPENPHEYKISHAFRATGAPENSTSLRLEPAAKWSIFRTPKVPPSDRHNITELALNEVWDLYGKDVEISAVFNIGPKKPSSSCGSERIAEEEEMLRKYESAIEPGIRTKLQDAYQEHTPPYYRLAPETADIEQFLSTDSAKVVIKKVVQDLS